MLDEKRKAELRKLDLQKGAASLKEWSQWRKTLTPEEDKFLIEEDQKMLDEDEGGVPPF